MEYAFGALAQGVFSNPDNISLLALKGEEFGFEMMWVNDHIIMPSSINSRYPYSEDGKFNEFGESGDYLEQLTVLSYLAALTSKVKLLSSVMVVPYRDPIVTAKMLSSIDILSEGRLLLGCGAGWMQEEFEALGRPPYEERGAVTEEYIRIFKNLWTEKSPSFVGQYTSYSNIVFEPKPVQKPHPPIWIGGESRAARERAVRVGDGWFPIIDNPRYRLDTPELFKKGVESLKTLSTNYNRDPKTVEIALAVNLYDDTQAHIGDGGRRKVFTGTHEQIASDIIEYNNAGAQAIMLGFNIDRHSPNATIEQMHRFSECVRPLVGT